jgi:tape measure domain-containing protein
MVAGYGAMGAVSTILALDDAHVKAENSLRKLVSSETQLQQTLGMTSDTAKHLHMDLGEAASAYAMVGEATQDLNLTTREQQEIFRGLGEVAAIDGGGIEEMTGMLQNLQYAMETGTLTGRELKTMMKQNDDVADLWTQRLGKSRTELLKLAESGKLGRNEIREMILALAGNEESHKKYEERSVSLSQKLHHLAVDVMEPLSLSFGRMKAAMDEAWEPLYRLNNGVIRLHASLSDALDKMRETTIIATVGGAFSGLDAVLQKVNKEIREYDQIAEYTGANGTKKYHDAMDALNRQLASGTISQEQFDRGLKAINESFGITTKATKEATQAGQEFLDVLKAFHAEEAKRGRAGKGSPTGILNSDFAGFLDPEAVKALDRSGYGGANQAWDSGTDARAEELWQEQLDAQRMSQPRDLEADLAGHRDTPKMNNIMKLHNAWIKAIDEMHAKTMERQRAMAEGFGDIGMSIVEMATSGKASVREMVTDMVAQMMKLMMTQAFTKLGELFTGQVAGPSGGSGWAASLVGQASGGIMKPSGSGGTDTQFVAFRKSPDETVRVHTPQQEAEFTRGGAGAKGGGSQTFNVRVDGSNPLQVLEGPDGRRTLIRIVTEAFPWLRTPSGR